MDLSVAIPGELKQAEYCELYDHYAYELPFILAWENIQAGNGYFMKKNSKDFQQTIFYSMRQSETLVSCTMKSIKTCQWNHWLPMKRL